MSERDEQNCAWVKLKIDQLRAHDLVDTGNVFDKQDPSLTISIGPKKFKTDRWRQFSYYDITAAYYDIVRKTDAGVEATFEEQFEFVTPWIPTMVIMHNL